MRRLALAVLASGVVVGCGKSGPSEHEKLVSACQSYARNFGSDFTEPLPNQNSKSTSQLEEAATQACIAAGGPDAMVGASTTTTDTSQTNPVPLVTTGTVASQCRAYGRQQASWIMKNANTPVPMSNADLAASAAYPNAAEIAKQVTHSCMVAGGPNSPAMKQ